MANIIDHLTWEVYLYIQRGLFERHKLPFALILATKILTSAGKVSIMHCYLVSITLSGVHMHFGCHASRRMAHCTVLAHKEVGVV